MRHDVWIEMAEIYALGALDGEDLRSLEKHLEGGCALCENHILITRNLLAELPSSLKKIAPPASVKTALMQKIGSAAPVAISAHPYRSRIILGAGMLVVSFFVALPSWMPQAPAKKVAAPLHDAGMMQILSGPETHLVEFKDLETGKKASAKLYWNPKACGGCFSVQGISKTQAGKIYELWAMRGETPVPAGTFGVDENGNAHLDIRALKEIGAFEKFAITIEPAGGVPLPTGPMKFLSV